jgi:phosphatidate cytidylyltransferase
MMATDLQIRSVLAPAMLLLIGGIYWLDHAAMLGKSGMLSAGVLGLLGIGGAIEYANMMRGAGFQVARWPLLAAAVLLHAIAIPLGWHTLDRELYPLAILTMALLFPLAVWSLGKEHMQRGLELQGGTMLGFLFVSWPMYLGQGICLRHLPSLLYVVLICKGGDIGAYVTGRLLGTKKLIPHVSPGKTLEGALGSLGFSVLLAVVLRTALVDDLGLSVWGAMGIGAMLNFTTQTGDLIESLLKRRCGAKDSSKLLPAHGGVLDLIDSLLFSFAAWFLVLIWLT